MFVHQPPFWHHPFHSPPPPPPATPFGPRPHLRGERPWRHHDGARRNGMSRHFHAHPNHAPPFAYMFLHNLFKILIIWIAASFILQFVAFSISFIMSPLVWVALLVTVFHRRLFHPHYFSHDVGSRCAKRATSCCGDREGNPCGNNGSVGQQQIPLFHSPPPLHFHSVASFFAALHDSANENNVSDNSKETDGPISSSKSSKDEANEEAIETVTSIEPKHHTDEDNEFFIVSIDVPGFQKDDLKISIVEAEPTMLVLGKRVVNNKVIEFKKKLTLDPMKVQLSYNDDRSDLLIADLSLGVLTIKFPKKEEEPPRLIPILVDSNVKHDGDKCTE